MSAFDFYALCSGVKVTARDGAGEHSLSERHRMGNLFLPEIARALRKAGFELVRSQSWMRRPPLDGRCVVARAR